MLRCFHYLRLCLRQNLLLVRPGPFVRAIAGVGKPGSTATPGGDLRKCVSVLPVFPLCSPATNIGGMANKRNFFKREHIPLSESGGQGSFVLLPRLSLFFCSRLASWKRFNFRVEARDTTKTDLKPLHSRETARCASRGHDMRNELAPCSK
jgi:hypothetical protein